MKKQLAKYGTENYTISHDAELFENHTAATCRIRRMRRLHRVAGTDRFRVRVATVAQPDPETRPRIRIFFHRAAQCCRIDSGDCGFSRLSGADAASSAGRTLAAEVLPGNPAGKQRRAARRNNFARRHHPRLSPRSDGGLVQPPPAAAGSIPLRRCGRTSTRSAPTTNRG